MVGTMDVVSYHQRALVGHACYVDGASCGCGSGCLGGCGRRLRDGRSGGCLGGGGSFEGCSGTGSGGGGGLSSSFRGGCIDYCIDLQVNAS